MQDDPLEDVIEDDDFFGDEDGVTVPALGKELGTYVGEYGVSGIFPEDGRDDISHTEQHFSVFTTFSVFACLVVMVTSAIFLICMLLGYV